MGEVACSLNFSSFHPTIYLATSRTLPRIIEVVKNSTKEKVVRVVVLTLRNLLSKGTFGAQMVDLGLPQIIQNLKAQAWSEELLVGSPGGIKSTGRGSEVDHPESVGESNLVVATQGGSCVLFVISWIALFFQDSVGFHSMEKCDPRALAVACFDISVFVQQRPAGSSIGTDLKAKERVIKLMNHESAEVSKNALLCIQRLFLGARYASVLQAYRCIPLNGGAEQWGSVF
ncbi:hypothetical protein C1H46_033839 [Malus baccata]|uniref:ATPase V1 complex subunit H C-terminal domain-containing protein n=1 Tax=Malus baccata TaxID=106549 RepID=A0A540L270_MALBA|nr:hypothetical protein C1H46_033839 [Malus baccata]